MSAIGLVDRADSQSQYWAVRDYLSPVGLVSPTRHQSCIDVQVLRESKFKEHGRITPGKLACSEPQADSQRNSWPLAIS